MDGAAEHEMLLQWIRGEVRSGAIRYRRDQSGACKAEGLGQDGPDHTPTYVLRFADLILMAEPRALGASQRAAVVRIVQP